MLADIGNIITNFSILEDLITRAIFKTSHLHKSPGEILLKRMPVDAKIKTLRVLAKNYSTKEEMVSFNNMLRDADFIRNARNDFAHGVCIGFGNNGYLFYQNTTFNDTEADIEALKETTDYVNRLKGAVVDSKVMNYQRIYIEEMSRKNLPRLVRAFQKLFKLQNPRDEYVGFMKELAAANAKSEQSLPEQ